MNNTKSKIFLTGASGYLGSAIAARLVRAGHEVLGLTRTPGAAVRLQRLGVVPVVGDLLKPETFVGTLKNCDAAIHAASADEGASPVVLDERALAAFADAAEDGRLRRFLYTSGLWVHGDTGGQVIDESTPLAPLDLVRWRAAHEDVVMDLAQIEVAPIVFRPGIVYGESRGILAHWFQEAKDEGTVSWYGSGEQCWPLVHRDDVAEAYALGLEHAAGGERYLLADGSSLTVREIAVAVASVTGATARAQSEEQVIATLGLLGRAFLASLRINATKARRDLGWVPRHTNFVAEVEAIHREWLEPREAQVK
jgi:nucleoside-diphosphate-sugar epimerase